MVLELDFELRSTEAAVAADVETWGSRSRMTTFGYLGRPDWRDMSDYLVHLTDSLSRLGEIIEVGHLAAVPLGAVPKHPSLEKLPSQRSCCLSEIPLDRLDRLAGRHGRYGVGFSKDFVRSQGGARVWYLDHNVEVTQALFESRRTTWHEEPDSGEVIWRLTPFIDYVMPNHEFEWEREWRVLDGLTFTPSDVRFLFAPEGQHVELPSRLRLEVPVVDPAWSEQAQIQAAFAPLPAAAV